MSFQDEEIQTMIRLGLTFCQAKVYLALARSGISTAKTISKVASVARPEVYRIMPELQKLGLAEKTITAPIKFKATPIREGIPILLDRKVKEAFELRKAARALVKNFKNNDVKTRIQEEYGQFVLIPENERVARIRRKLIETAQTSIDVVTLWKRHAHALLALEELLQKALKRGVHVRSITEKLEDEEQLAQKNEIAKAFNKYPSFQIKHVNAPIKSIVAVFDKKEVLVFTSAALGLDEASALWSTNPHLVALAENYFEYLWNGSLENEHEQQ